MTEQTTTETEEQTTPTYTLAETYNSFKDILIYKLENNIEVAQHVGMYMDVRDAYKGYYGMYPAFSELKSYIQNDVVDTYKRMLELTQQTGIEDFDTDEYTDPYLAIVNEVDLVDDDSVFRAYLRMKCVKPYGSDLHGYYRDYYQERENLKDED